MSRDKAALLREELAGLRGAAQHLRYSWQRSDEVLARDDWDDAALERLESLASRFARLADLVRIRELRNLIAHEYAGDKLAEIYRAVARLAPVLLDVVERTAAYGDDALRRYGRLMGG
ncbi:hypothetical protein [Methylogaea oryzae]|uniref:DUF86 domain-containing protein n=1 Tax=Methylogaea oryzae TaxID=1295382 RepID=A0A8D4VPU9_9GAMM|nr:hypothetical protein [Methylogaea oryzae]BBL70270.1 hypothetical protein MoryE10_08760 [Methylogaea oryzae]